MAFPTIVDILFENYTVARSKTIKKVEAEKLQKLLNEVGSSFESSSIIESMPLAEAHLALAKMLKGIGYHQKARDEADKAFNLCMEDLQDFTTFNDMEAFRMLSKTLMFVPGLEIDAGIALSLQYSDVEVRPDIVIDYRRERYSEMDDRVRRRRSPSIRRRSRSFARRSRSFARRSRSRRRRSVESVRKADEDMAIDNALNGETSGDVPKSPIESGAFAPERATPSPGNLEHHQTNRQKEKASVESTTESYEKLDMNGNGEKAPVETSTHMDKVQPIVNGEKLEIRPLQDIQKSGV